MKVEWWTSPRTRTSSLPVPSTPKNSPPPKKSPDPDGRASIPESTTGRGARGEATAAEFLIAHDYRILERNFRNRSGEVDIIAVEGGTIAFCEVKSWERMPIAGLEYALSRRKQGRIIRTSLWYLHTHPNLSRLQPRFDVLFVHDDEVQHFPDAFCESGAW
ncbi:MAG: YraN family protein [Spirochaetota bacterium]